MRRIEIIKQKVSLYFEINPVHMTDHKRMRRFARPRQIAMFLCRKHTDMSLPAIASEFLRDHTTVIHAVRQVVILAEKNEEVKNNLADIERMLPWMAT